MYQQAMVIGLYAETPVHAGTGSTPGIVDLPIQRERYTQYPVIQASGVKGVLRDFAAHQRNGEKRLVELIFGPDTQNAAEYAAAISVTDARVLCFPVRALQGVFVWATSPYALSRFRRDVEGTKKRVPWDVPAVETKAVVADKGVLVDEGMLVLEEYGFEAEVLEKAKQIAQWIAQNLLPQDPAYQYWREQFQKRFVILPEDAFRDFVLHSTEIVSRIKLDDTTKTVQRGALWTEEYLPSETLLYSCIFATQPRAPKDNEKDSPLDASGVLLQLRRWINRQRIQLGGNATIGRGIVYVHVLGTSNNGNGDVR